MILKSMILKSVERFSDKIMLKQRAVSRQFITLVGSFSSSTILQFARVSSNCDRFAK